MILLLAFGFLLIAVLEVPGLLKKRAWRELAAFSFYLALGLALALPQVLGFEIPSPNILIEAMVEPVANWLK
ncbi:MAG: hypothetical protein K6T29_08285 [Peptococcaceae bacterium]|nr:hypothetical protein [Peptococcaceae bacterium]